MWSVGEIARELSWKDNAVQFKPKIKKHGFGIATITLGSRGSVTYADDKVIIIPAFPVETVDTTGAGDVFHGGYIYGLLRKWSLQATVRFRVGRRCNEVQESGGTAGIPRPAEVQQFLEERELSIASRSLSDLTI